MSFPSVPVHTAGCVAVHCLQSSEVAAFSSEDGAFLWSRGAISWMHAAGAHFLAGEQIGGESGPISISLLEAGTGQCLASLPGVLGSDFRPLEVCLRSEGSVHVVTSISGALVAQHVISVNALEEGVGHVPIKLDIRPNWVTANPASLISRGDRYFLLEDDDGRYILDGDTGRTTWSAFLPSQDTCTAIIGNTLLVGRHHYR